MSDMEAHHWHPLSWLPAREMKEVLGPDFKGWLSFFNHNYLVIHYCTCQKLHPSGCHYLFQVLFFLSFFLKEIKKIDSWIDSNCGIVDFDPLISTTIM